MIDKISDFLLENLAFFFIPVGVSLITSFGLLEGKWNEIIVVSIISTIIILGLTGLTVEFTNKILWKKPETSCCEGQENSFERINKIIVLRE